MTRQQQLSMVVGRIQALGTGEVCPLNLEQAALLQAFPAYAPGRVRSQRERAGASSENRVALDAFRDASAAKTAGDQGSHFERRTQFALRSAIDKVMQERWSELTPDERRLLRGARSIFERRGPSASNERMHRVLTQVVGKLNEHQRQLRAHNRSESCKDGSRADARKRGAREKGPAQQLRAEELQGGQRTTLSLLEDIAIELSVRRFDFDGRCGNSRRRARGRLDSGESRQNYRAWLRRREPRRAGKT